MSRGKNVLVPDGFVTMTQGILGQKGKGKSYVAGVQAEELLDDGEQVVVIDPTGSWFGLRSSPDGKSTGYPIAIFGGEHADVKLEPTAGAVIAEAIATEHFSAVIDLTLFRKGEALRFMAAFLETLYHKNRTAVHVFIDEADVVAPQKTFSPEQARALGASEDLVRRGRIRGIGVTLITQRPQVLNKDVLSQVDILTTLGMSHPKDLGAIGDWVAVHGDPKKAERMIATLPSMHRGKAWVWAPELGIFDQVDVRKKWTFDSGRTPKSGERIAAPKVLARVDIARLGAAVAETVERAKAEDPKALRARVAELERQNQSLIGQTVRGAKMGGKVVERVIEKPVINKATIVALERSIARGDKAVATGTVLADKAGDMMKKAAEIMAMSALTIERDLAAVRVELARAMGKALERVPAPSVRLPAPMPTAPRSARMPRSGAQPINSSDLTKMDRAMLTALAQHPDGLSKRKLRVHTGYADSGPVSKTFARLVGLSWALVTGDKLAITDAGLAALGGYEPLPLGDALRMSLLQGTKLSKMERAILDVVCNAYPRSVSKADIRLQAGYADSGPVSRAFAKLVAMDYLQPQGRELVAAEELFDVGQTK